MPELLSSRTVTARKPHRCSFCGTVAATPGQQYQREVYTDGSRAYTLIVCADCDALTGDVWDWAADYWEGVDREDYRAWATDHLGDPRAVTYLQRAGAD